MASGCQDSKRKSSESSARGPCGARARLQEPGMAPYDVEIFFDGECPLCMREVRLLRRLDRKQRVRFTDIAAAGFDPSALGLDMAALMARIHGRLPDGTILEGVEVFRRVYEAVGLGVLAKVSRWPGISALTEAAYEIFAKNRLRLTGRCDHTSCSVAVGVHRPPS
jgi:predicted DCC family thiol-disulfide oxidoreductase YuxK